MVVEVDGPKHYCCNDLTRMTGTSRLKHRLLAAQRHRWAAVISINLVEWEPLGYSPKKKQAFLMRKLRDAGVELEAYSFGLGPDARRQCALLEGAHCTTEVLLGGGGGEGVVPTGAAVARGKSKSTMTKSPPPPAPKTTKGGGGGGRKPSA